MRLALRRLLHAPAYSLLAFLTLAIGIAASVAGFTVLKTVVLDPLPYPSAGRLVFLHGSATNTDNLPDWRRHLTSFDSVSALSPGLANVDTPNGPEQLPALYVSAEFSQLLGLRPTAGRLFVPDDFRTGAVVAISDQLATRLFGSPAAAVGHVLHLIGTGYVNQSWQVIGAFPPLGPLPYDYSDADFLFPQLPMPRPEGVGLLARLKPRVSLAAARSEANAIALSLAPAKPNPGRPFVAELQTLKDKITEDSALTVRLLFAAALLVLLITCANVAHMVLARSAARSRETAVRLAIGASRIRLARDLLLENFLLCAAAALAGLWLSSQAVRVLVAVTPFHVPRLADAHTSAAVVAFTLAVVLLSSLAFVLAPLLESRDLDLNRALKEGSQQAGGSSRQRWLRSLLVTTEIAVACVVLVVAGLLLESFLALRPANPGFNPHQKLILRVGNTKAKDEDSIPLVGQLQSRIAALPGVRQVAATTDLPMTGTDWLPDVKIAGQTVLCCESPSTVHFRSVTPNYFSTMEMPLVAGRGFDDADFAGQRPFVLVNQQLARTFFSSSDPLGGQIELLRGGPKLPPLTIVGVLHDARLRGTLLGSRPEAFIPFSLAPYRGFYLVIATSGDPLRIAADVRSVVRSVAPQAIVSDMQTMDEAVAQSVAEPRFDALLLGILAGLAVVLALAGIYAVMSYSVAQRTHEMGVRIAVGARTANVLSLVLGGALRLAVVGVALGTSAALFFSGALRSLLFGIAPADPRSYLASAILLLLLALAAAYGPALRAARTDPLTALRAE